MKNIQEKWVYVLVGVLVLAFVFVQSFQTKSDQVTLQQLLEDQTSYEVIESESASESISEIIYVDVKGQVMDPGMYQMKLGDRINDVIIKAGGFTQAAAADYVNLAQILQDQMVIYVPNVNDESVQTLADLPIPHQANEEGDSRININTADSQDLMTLPNIGPKKAQAIIEYRQSQGSFQQIEDIMEVSGIGEKTYLQLQDLIRVD